GGLASSGNTVRGTNATTSERLDLRIVRRDIAQRAQPLGERLPAPFPTRIGEQPRQRGRAFRVLGQLPYRSEFGAPIGRGEQLAPRRLVVGADKQRRLIRGLCQDRSSSAQLTHRLTGATRRSENNRVVSGSSLMTPHETPSPRDKVKGAGQTSEQGEL